MGNQIQISSSMSADDQGKKNRPPPGENRPPPPENQNGVVASLAHEINNPLAALLNLLHLIESQVPLTEKGRQYLALSHEEIQRISRILHTAMEFRDTGDPEETNVSDYCGPCSTFTDRALPRGASRSIHATVLPSLFPRTRANYGKCFPTSC
jgi:hypothetical protein